MGKEDLKGGKGQGEFHSRNPLEEARRERKEGRTFFLGFLKRMLFFFFLCKSALGKGNRKRRGKEEIDEEVRSRNKREEERRNSPWVKGRLRSNTHTQPPHNTNKVKKLLTASTITGSFSHVAGMHNVGKSMLRSNEPCSVFATFITSRGWVHTKRHDLTP